MDHTSTFEAYMMFRMSEAEHAHSYKMSCECDTAWIEQSANVEYERHLMEVYDSSLVSNSQVY